jgi:UDP-N-acetylglucosamine 2-epimerase (non-hydrolysing)
MKLLFILGTRPEAIKLFPIIKKFQENNNVFDTHICITAQHREMVDDLFNLFNLKADFDLNIMSENQTPTQVAAEILKGLEPILLNEKPDWIFIQGDTTTVMSAAITCFYNKIKVAHVEAGLRTYNKYWPFPEEINRQITSVVCDLHFAPTLGAKENLLKENISAKNIIITGNPVIDALLWIQNLSMPVKIEELINNDKVKDKKIILVTAHRRENFGQGILHICQALKKIAKIHKKLIHIIYAVHPNPNIKKPVYELLNKDENITLIAPLMYDELVHLMKKSYLVLTDSGGIQEEAPSLGKPVLVLREVTERPEAVKIGTVKLVGTNTELIVDEVTKLIKNQDEYNRMANKINPYGDGLASDRMVKYFLNEPFDEFKF